MIYLAAALWKAVPRFPFVVRPAEVLYGFLNPLVYLVILEGALKAPPVWALTVAAWILLALVWSSRFTLGTAEFRRSRGARLYVRWLSIAALTCLLAFVVKDARTAAPFLVGWTPGLFYLAPLYVIPGLLVLHHFRWAGREGAWEAGRHFFLSRPAVGWAAVTLLVATVGVVSHRPPVWRVEQVLRQHRADIVTAARHHGVDPALLASIVYVTQRDLTNSLATRLERLVLGVWQGDAHDDFFLARRLDLSVGVAQIKPLTAMAALVIHAAPRVPPGDNLVWAAVSGLQHPVSFKEYRGVPALGSRWRLPGASVGAIDSPFQGLLAKPKVVEALFDDRRNIEMCALILALYAAQWEAADPAWSIRGRPEILATLYQLGFEKSWPKPDPRPNRFGEPVREVYRSGFILRHFGSGTARAGDPTS